MAFNFNFNISPPFQYESQTKTPSNKSADGDEDHERKQIKLETSRLISKQVKEAQEHKHTPGYLTHIENSVTETLTVGTLPSLIYLNESVIEQTAPERDDDENILTETASQNSDLITGVYEGGLKIWEGTYDLLEYVDEEGVTLSGKTVLDLGCGAGLLGILALKRGASMVHFQDYNSTVVEQLTIPNVFINHEEGINDRKEAEKDGSPAPKRKTLDLPLMDHCRFFSGDWTSFLSLLQSTDQMLKYDLIFTSETIYNTEYYPSLHNVFHNLLAKDGVVYLATKSHYFGVGGGLFLFENFVKERDVFQIKSLKDLDQGLKRHIVSLRFNKSS